MKRPLLPGLLVFTFLSAIAFSADPEETGGKKNDDRTPKDVSLGDTGEIALKKFTVAPGLRVNLWAEEPLLANPVAFTFDNKGRAFVVETYRRRTSVPDIRKNMEWLPDSLAMRTVEDRVAFLQRALAPELNLKPTKNHEDLNGDGHFDWHDWAIESERVKVVEDRNGTGAADTSSVFAEGFNTPETGVAAGVAVRGDDVFFACIPDVWRLHGASGVQAAAREKLLSGFGVHIAYGGHDMHGTKFGPDGRLYWSIADCGAHVTTKEGKVLDNPDSGAVFRCELDGSHAEIVAVGLRNPQSLAFNDLGDLFTGDNNADGGDKARWTHIVEGGDYGWRMGWQFLPKLGAWNSEGMWHLDVDKTALALLPPVGLIGHGPAGIAHYPGTGLPDSYKDNFFYADFPGGVRAFPLQPKGASYTADNPKDILQDNSPKEMTGKLLWGLFPSDVGFGVDGGAYVLDWVQGWEKTGKGRIYRVHDPAVDASPLVQETKKLLGEGMSKRDEDDLTKLLGHADQRVRLAAQFELVRRGDPTPLAQATHEKNPQLVRLHGIWGVAQMARRKPGSAKTLPSLAEDKDPEVRAQWAKFIGEAGMKAQADRTIRLLADSEPRVRFFAAQALGKLGVKEAVPALIALLKLNADTDAYVRHATVMALVALADEKDLIASANDPAVPVRTGVLLALRRLQNPAVAQFLTDKNPQLVVEAARAIHDAPIPAAWPQLAALAANPSLPASIIRRAINANYLLGNAKGAQRLAKVGGDPKADVAQRIGAVQALAIWNEPFKRDAVTGLWRDLPKTRDANAASAAANRIVPALLREPTEDLRVAAAELAGSLKAQPCEGVLYAAVSDRSLGGKTRAAALRALDAMDSARLADAYNSAIKDTDKALLEAARHLAAKVSPADAVKLNADVLGKGNTREQQVALANIAGLPGPEADQVLLAQYDRFAVGKLKPALWLDLFEAMGERDDPELKRRLTDRDVELAKSKDPIAKWRECLEGGNAKAGREIFAEKAEAACMRCHKFKGEGGDVGPDLAKIAQVSDRVYLLESIVDPNAKIAPGYDNVLFTLQNGEMVSGILNAESPEEITITSVADGKKQKIKVSDIKERMHVPSAMPPGLADVLGKRGLRDVIEFLSSAK